MTKALALSGGGARGSFQLGAIMAIYEVYGFRPDLITGTSVGSVNAIMLAQAPPPQVNDAGRILAAVAAGTVDPGLARARMLKTAWLGFRSPSDFFTIQPVFAGTALHGAVNGINRPPSGDPPLQVTLAEDIDLMSGVLAAPLLNLVTGPIAAAKLQEYRPLVLGLLTENSICNLDPIMARLNNPSLLNLSTLAAGTPVWFATVSLESGRLRYVDGTGRFTESDLRTPVVTALTNSDVAAVSGLAADRRARITGLLTSHAAVVSGMARQRAVIDSSIKDRTVRLRAIQELSRLKERGDFLVRALRGQIRDLPITTRADPRRGVIASAAIPCYFDPVVIGSERYVDGGLREVLPTAAFRNRGVTELIGISCSTSTLPETDSMSSAGLPAVALRSLTEITLQEVTQGDIETARNLVPSAVIIEPLFDVHGVIEVVPGLIEISEDYGWMRACDELQPGLDAKRDFGAGLSTRITRVRRDSWTDEWLLSGLSLSLSAEGRRAVKRIRLRAWIVRELLLERTRLGLPTHPLAGQWSRTWSRDFRSSGLLGSQSIWATLVLSSSDGSSRYELASAVADPDAFLANEGAVVDRGDDRVYWVVRGAVFLAAGETETNSPWRGEMLTVPSGTTGSLPHVPRGRHLMAETGAPGAVWVVAEGRRFPATPELVSAAGLAGAEVALLPAGGLQQIQVGTSTAWLNRLAVTDSAKGVLTSWDAGAAEEGSVTPMSIGLTNFTGQPIRVTELSFRSDQDTPGNPIITVTGPLPVVPATSFVWVPVQFAPRVAGTISGRIRVNCDDPLTGAFEINLEALARSQGPVGRLEVSPTAMDFGTIRVGAEPGRALELRNAGDAALELPAITAQQTIAESGFGIPPILLSVLPLTLSPGRSTTVWVSCRPGRRGEHAATIAIDTLARTKSGRELHGRVEVPVNATAVAPQVFLPARLPLPPLPPGHFRPPLTIDLPPRNDLDLLDLSELQRIDFGPIEPSRSLTRDFRIRNIGDAPLRVAGIRTSGPVGIADLSVFPRDLAPGQEMTATVNVVGSSVRGEPVAGEVTVVTDDPWRPDATFQVTALTMGARLVAHEQLDLGSGPSPLTASIIFTSEGTEPARVTQITISGTGFTLVNPPTLPLQVAPGTTFPLAVSYTHDPTLTHRPLGHVGVTWRGNNNAGDNWIQLVADPES